MFFLFCCVDNHEAHEAMEKYSGVRRAAAGMGCSHGFTQRVGQFKVDQKNLKKSEGKLKCATFVYFWIKKLYILII